MRRRKFLIQLGAGLSGGAFATLSNQIAARGGLADRADGSKSPLGLNLSAVVDYGSEIVFVDAFQTARAWISQAKGKPWGKGGPLALDNKGHVQSLAPGQFAESIIFTGFEKRFPAGTFTCLYEGEGLLDFGFDARLTDHKPGELKVEIQPKNGQASARLMMTNPKNPLRNIRLILPGFEKEHVRQPFHPDFLSRWQGFSVLRFMDWGQTNNSPLVEWRDRPTLDMHSQAIVGVAPEYMTRLCNQLNVEPWFCMPHLASDDYVRQFARLVHGELEPKRAIHVEYTNECWNSQFHQARHATEEGTRLALGSNPHEARLRYYSKRSVEIFKIWQEELGNSRPLVRVLATQAANVDTGKTVLQFGDAAHQADAIAIAPYFGHGWGDPKEQERVVSLTPDELLTSLEGDVARSREHIEAYAALAKTHGLKLMAYEGGQHLAGNRGAENNEQLTALFHAVNRHPRMKQLYLRNLADWREAGGGLFCLFSSMGNSSKWGSWGLLENTAQDPQTAPKYQAVREYLRG